MICIDWSVDMAQARKILGDKPVSGNVDPLVLLGPENKVRRVYVCVCIYMYRYICMYVCLSI